MKKKKKNYINDLINLKYGKMKEIIIELGSLKLRVEGRSMEPTIQNGELINVISPMEINIGDILLYQRRYDLLLHRVIEKEPMLCMKGDNENFQEYIDTESVIGKYNNDVENNNITKTFNISDGNYMIEFQVQNGILEKIEVYSN